MRIWITGIVGVILGAIIAIWVLSFIGNKAEQNSAGNTVKNILADTPGGPTAVPMVQETSSATPSPVVPNAFQNFERGGFKYKIPDNYRIAEDIVRLDQKNAPAGYAILTLTKGSVEKEKEYVELIKKLQNDRATTEAPQFLPGQTIGIYLTNETAERTDASLAHTKEVIKTAQGLSGTRYKKVEGLFSYDVTFLNLPNGKKVAVQMNYASEPPFFDETAFIVAVNSIASI